ncbi:hypothetical protein FHS76_003628 [Ochrobactrum daejeonense]|uniref:Uncharacterized protein n=1 Tax=Brucella daejeonensis TaxID=659015 RepID=A0A7W9AZZ4_9HYPH|nr:hypothetical protein [Brucella daejeonensis]MBB5703718.1 hypothetical protein [Brucella daejeonensis]
MDAHFRTLDRLARSEARIRLAHQLQTAHGIDPADLAELLSLPVSQYLNRLERLKLTNSNEQADTRKRERNAVLERLQAELKRLLDGEELPDKSKAEALTALARAVKSVGELASDEKVAGLPAMGGMVTTVGEARKALKRISRRIEELAERRAREIVAGRIDAASNCGSGGGMAASGA